MKPFRAEVAQHQLTDLADRLASARLPAQLPGTPWERGVPRTYLESLARYWAQEYDWRATERRLNAHPQYVAQIDGVEIHFLHVRSPHPHATPLLLTHGWPGSVLDFLDVIGPLTDPPAHGGDPDDAFHLVIPALPGFGFSSAPAQPGWGIPTVAAMWAELMARLGYERYVAQGGDLGAAVTLALAGLDAEHVLGAHVNFLVTPPPPGAALRPEEAERMNRLRRFATDGGGYMAIQATRPQTLAYALTDSPVGQLAWLVEKYVDWSETAERAPSSGAQSLAVTREPVTLTRDQILDGVTLSWLTQTAGPMANFYYEIADLLPTSPDPAPAPPPLQTPLGVAVYAHDCALPVREFARSAYPNIVQWNEFERGGHFPALERPQEFVRDLRDFRDCLRGVEELPTAA